MIKQVFTHIKLATISMLLLSACAQDDMFSQEGVNSPGDSDLLAIRNVSVSGFSTNGAARATNDGKEVTFVADDQMGILLLDNEGELIKNAAFKYTITDGVTTWTNAENVSYSKKIAKAIAYFPYSELANAAKSIDELKALAPLKADQSNVDNFKAMDLLIDEIDEVSSASLTIQLEHAYSLVAFSAKGTIHAGEESFDYFTELSDVAFAIGEQSYTPCSVGGEYVCLLPSETVLTKDVFRYFYTTAAGVNIKTLKENQTLAKNSRYTFPCSGTSSEVNTVAAGDFYCVSTKGNAVILPGSAAAIPAGLTCQGIVFYTMDAAKAQQFVSDNNIQNVTIADDDAPHGLVASLKNGGALPSKADDATDLAALVTGINNDNMVGYLITQKLKGKYTDWTLNNHTTASVSGSISGWYGASIKEMLIMGQGNDQNVKGKDGIILLNKQFGKCNGEKLGGNIPSVSFHTTGTLGFMFFSEGTGGDLGQYYVAPGEAIRPIFAF